ncbi:transcription factor [Biscogniauxia mediterranea]|nr:transcription factor [Biscogniauxia mediterranea]
MAAPADNPFLPPPSAIGHTANGEDDKPWQENLNQILTCPDCNEFPPNLVEEFSSGDMVCASCGLVLGARIIDTRSEWRTFANDDQNNDDPSRVGDGPNTLLNGDQLETTIAFGEGSRSRELHRAQNRSTQDKATKALLNAYRDIGNLCDAINIPKATQDSAKHMYKMTDDAKILKGKSTEAIIAGCIFIACRQSKIGRTFREIHALTKVSKKEIGRTFKVLEKFLQEHRDKNTAGSFMQPLEPVQNTNSTNAAELCARYCSQLRFNNPHLIEKLSVELCDKCSSLPMLAGRSPLSIAASCIYMISHLMGDPRSYKAIARVAGVSDGTIKTAYRFIWAEREKVTDKAWLDKGGRLDLLPPN